MAAASVMTSSSEVALLIPLPAYDRKSKSLPGRGEGTPINVPIVRPLFNRLIELGRWIYPPLIEEVVDFTSLHNLWNQLV